MKVLSLDTSICRAVNYFDITVWLVRNECIIAADADGQLWAYTKMPIALHETKCRGGQWAIQAGEPYPRCIGHVDLEEVNWRESIVDYGCDTKEES